jgi:hypothetical protein
VSSAKISAEYSASWPGPSAARARRKARREGSCSKASKAFFSAAKRRRSSHSKAWLKRCAMLLEGIIPKPNTYSTIHPGPGSTPTGAESSHAKQRLNHSDGCVRNWLKQLLMSSESRTRSSPNTSAARRRTARSLACWGSVGLTSGAQGEERATSSSESTGGRVGLRG